MRVILAGMTLAICVSGCKYLFPVQELMKQARAFEAAGNYQEAKGAYEKLIREHPDRPEALEALSRVATIYDEHLKNWQKAAAYLQELRSKTRGKLHHAQVLLRLGRLLERSGPPYKDALDAYGMICQDCGGAPESVQALLALGRIHESMQDWPSAKQDYEMAVRKLGSSPQAETIRVRLQSVWLLEALGAYFAGDLAGAVKLSRDALAKSERARGEAAGVALKKGAAGTTLLKASDSIRLTMPEVRRGLEDLLRRHRNAKRLWTASAGMVILDDLQIGSEVDPARFIIKALTRQAHTKSAAKISSASSSLLVASDDGVAETEGLQPVPEGWRMVYSKKGKKFTLYREPEYRGKKRRPWTFDSYEKYSYDGVEGFWFSPDGGRLGWLGRHRKTRTMKIRLLDLKKLKDTRPMFDSSGKVLGHCMLFLPHCTKMIFPFGNYLAVSDLRGLHRVIFSLPDGYLPGENGGRGPKVRFSGKNVEWMACSADGLEVAVASRQTSGKAKGRLAVWKLALATGGE